MRKIHSNVIALCSVLFVLATTSHGGYRDLMEQTDGWTPPTHLGGPLVPAPLPSTRVEEANVEPPQAPAAWDEARSSLLGDLRRPVFLVQGLDGEERQKWRDEEALREALAKPFTVAQLERWIAARNPGVEAARLSAYGAAEQFNQVSLLDEILASYSAFTEGVMNPAGPMKGMSGGKMDFPFPAVTALKGSVAEANLRQKVLDHDAALRDALTEGRTRFWELVYVDGEIGLRGETLALLERLDTVATTLYETGRVSFDDVVKVRIRIEMVNNMLTTLSEKKVNLQTGLRALLGVGNDAAIGKTLASEEAPMALPAEAELVKMALAARQELDSMRVGIEKMVSMRLMGETMVVPAFDQGFSRYDDAEVMRTGSSAMKPTFTTTKMASTGAGLPVKPWYGTGTSYLRELKLKEDAMRAKLADMEWMTTSMVRMLWFEADRAHRDFDLYDATIVNLTDAALEVSFRAYETGKQKFSEVIGTYTAWLDANLGRARKRADIHIAMAKLEQWVGRPLASSAVE